MTARELASKYRTRIVLRRGRATIVDFIVLLILGLTVGALVPHESTAVRMFIFFGVPLLYYMLLEATLGHTVGKLLLGLKVVDESGAVPSLQAVLVRTFTRLLEVNPLLLCGLPAAIIADRSETHQRWGDMLAHTYVVLIKDLASLHARTSETAG